MSVLPRPLTDVDFDALPPEDGKRLELIDGELIVSPAPVTDHQDLVVYLVALFFQHVRTRRLGRVFVAPYAVRLRPYDTVQPDVLFVAGARVRIITPKRIEGAPDLVVEISSPDSGVRDRIRKFRLYETAGVREYWYVDAQERTLTIYVLDEDGRYEALPADGTRLRSGVLPDLEIDSAALFARPD